MKILCTAQHSTAQHSTAQHSTAQPLLYGKEQSNLIAGIAILLMMVHHFFSFSELPREGICEPLIPPDLVLKLASFGKMCVAIFAFNTGYAMWVRRQDYTYAKIPKRIFKFLLQYWVICLLFIVYGFIVGDTLPTARQFACNLFGFEITGSYISCIHAWYVYFYVTILLLSPMIVWVFQRKMQFMNEAGYSCLIALMLVLCARLACLSLSQFALPVIDGVVSSLNSYLGCVLMGLLAAKLNIFALADHMMKSRCIFLYTGLIVLVVYIRQNIDIPIIGTNRDAIYVIVLVYCILSILRRLKSKSVEQVLSILGKYSMNMWFLHALFHVGTLGILNRVLYLPLYPILILIWGVVMVLPVAVFCSYLQNIVMKMIFRPKSASVAE